MTRCSAGTVQPRSITADEVRVWFQRLGAAVGDGACEHVASRLQRIALSRITPRPKPTSDPAGDTVIIWDFKGVADAAKTVQTNIPTMLSSWQQMLETPETRAGYEAIKALEGALNAAMPFIEYPWGFYEKKNRHHHPPKPWHTPAVIICRIFTDSLIQVGHKRPARSRNSVMVSVIHAALERTGYGRVGASAIAMHLDRWFKRAGEPPGWV